MAVSRRTADYRVPSSRARKATHDNNNNNNNDNNNNNNNNDDDDDDNSSENNIGKERYLTDLITNKRSVS